MRCWQPRRSSPQTDSPRPAPAAPARRWRRPLELADVERANRRLAAALSADGGAVTNAATILRPPSTHNFKGDELRPVRLLDAASLRQYRAAQIVGTLPISSRPAGKAAAAAHH